MKKVLALLAACLVSACSGGGNDGPLFPNPGEPNETFASATSMTPGVPVVATVANGIDYDLYEFTVPTGGASVLIQTFDQSGASCDLANGSVDPYVEVYDPSQPFVTASDDSGINRCEDFTVSLPAGTNYVAVSGYPPYPFVYTLEVTIL